MMISVKRLGLAILAVLMLAAVSQAQSADDAVRFKITAGGRDLYKLAVPLPLGDKTDAKSAQDVLSNDLALAGFFKVLDPSAFLANLDAEQLNINPPDWVNVGAEGVIKARATAYGSDVKYEFRLYEVAKGNAPVLSKDYRGPAASMRQLAHQFAGDVVRYYTNEDSFFSSQMTWAGDNGPHRRDIYVADWDGFGARAITHSSQNILPTWAKDGSEIAFTTFAAGKPDLVALPPSGAGKPRNISTRQGVNTGAAWSPDGTKIAMTLSFEGNAQIYLLSRDGQIISRLTHTSRPFIDTSPTWSPDGNKIAFVSDRFGSPQIWVMNADGSNQQRLTRRGNYNQEPSWCPRKDTPLIAFTARDEKYAYDIFTINVDSGELVRITEGHGSNHHATWAPNGRAIAYQSSRGGLWISTADGRTERQVYRGSVEAPQWGPQMKK
jgi:TolB protein